MGDCRRTTRSSGYDRRDAEIKEKDSIIARMKKQIAQLTGQPEFKPDYISETEIEFKGWVPKEFNLSDMGEIFGFELINPVDGIETTIHEFRYNKGRYIGSVRDGKRAKIKTKSTVLGSGILKRTEKRWNYHEQLAPTPDYDDSIPIRRKREKCMYQHKDLKLRVMLCKDICTVAGYPDELIQLEIEPKVDDRIEAMLLINCFLTYIKTLDITVIPNEKTKYDWAHSVVYKR